jgi:O-antigen ligase
VYDAETGQVLAELGWPGFIAWYSFRIMMVWHCWVAFNRSRPSMFRSIAFGFFCYQFLLLTGSFVLNHTANVFSCAAWGFCLIPNLESLVRRKQPMQQQVLHARGSRLPRLHG